MAYTQVITRKDGSKAYRIRVTRGRDNTEHSMTWTVPDKGWGKRKIAAELKKVIEEFENKIERGEAKTRAEAKAEQQQLQAARAKIQTFKEYTDAVFMKQIEATRAENTRSLYESFLRLHIYPHIGDSKIDEITTQQLEALLLDFQIKDRMKHKTVKMGHNILSQVFRKACKAGIIERSKNPMYLVDCPPPTNQESKETTIEMYTAEELQYILRCLENEPLLWQAYIRLLIDTGCRRGEACGLRWGCVDLDKGEIRIEKSLNYTPSKGVFEGSTKTGHARTIPISTKTAGLLKQIKEQQKQAKVVSLDGYVFTKADNVTVISPNTPSQYFTGFGKKYGLVHFHPHKLRHTAISQLLISGADIKTVADIAGHANATMTLSVYAHSDAETQRKALETYRREALQEKEA